MKKFIEVMMYSIAAGLFGLTLILPARAQSSVKGEKELIKLQYEWAEARVKRDVAFLESHYAKEFRITALNGSVVGEGRRYCVFCVRRSAARIRQKRGYESADLRENSSRNWTRKRERHL